MCVFYLICQFEAKIKVTWPWLESHECKGVFSKVLAQAQNMKRSTYQSWGLTRGRTHKWNVQKLALHFLGHLVRSRLLKGVAVFRRIKEICGGCFGGKIWAWEPSTTPGERRGVWCPLSQCKWGLHQEPGEGLILSIVGGFHGLIKWPIWGK